MRVGSTRERATRSIGRWPIFGLALAALSGGSAITSGAMAAGVVLPTGGVVAAGSVSIGAPSGANLVINQSSSRAIIDWNSFSIGQGDGVTFTNGSGATLNRVAGLSPSVIDGLLSATGSVYLVNPNGVVVGKGGVVNVGGTFAASTLDVANGQFMGGGDLTFTGDSNAAVINYGKIGALGGDVALIAMRVANSGEIDAPRGDVGLAAGYQVLLRDAALDDGKFWVALGGTGTSVTNAGVIAAADAELRANGGNVYALAGNTGSIIKADGVSSNDGKVFLVATGGTLEVAGTVQARGANGAPGQIETSGASVVVGAADIDAGPGGRWLLDPDDLAIDQTAADTLDASLNAGTNVVQETTASGSGGAGDITVDPNVTLNWSTAADLTLSAYRDIDLGAGVQIASTGGGSVTLRADNTGTGVGTVSFASGAAISTAGAVDIYYNPSVNPAGSPVNSTSYATPAESYAGSVSGGGALNAYMLVNTVDDLQNIQNNLSGTYALGRDIDATATAGWNAGAGFAPVGGNGAADFTGTFEGDGHTVANLFIDYSTVSASTSADGFTSDGSAGLFGVVGGAVRDVTLANVNVSAANGMSLGALAGVVTGEVSNVTISGVVTGGARGDINGAPGIGGVVGSAVDGGTLSGLHSSATVSGGEATVVGGAVGALGRGAFLSDSSASGSVSTGGGVAGQYSAAGGLVGTIYGYQFGAVNPLPSYISNSYATGSVTAGGGSLAGGFIGSIAQGVVTTSYATGSVTQTAAGQNTDLDIAGGFTGLVGLGSVVSQSYSSGAVTTVSQNNSLLSFAGGFVGLVNPTGSVNDSYSLGAVTGLGGFNIIGGFAGLVQVGPTNDAGGISTAMDVGSISNVYAAGRVSGTGIILAGLVGLNQGSISNGYWDVGTTGQSLGFIPAANPPGSAVSSATNIVGLSGAAVYAEGSYAGFDFSASGPWVIFDGSTRPMLRMEASTTISNGHQLQLMALDPTASYVLASDIDLSATANTSDVWNPATGFVPVGGNAELDFTGAFDGAGHTLSNLFINYATVIPVTGVDGFSVDGEVGLFGTVATGGVVKNLTLANAHVMAADGMDLGALAGAVSGQVSNVTTSGVVSGGARGDVNTAPSIGGVVGAAFDGGVLSDLHSSATVSGGDATAVGGAVGGMGRGTVLNDSSASGDVSVGGGVAGQYSAAGGLVGSIYTYQFGAVNPLTAYVSNSYATGSVTGGGGSIVGGLVGSLAQGVVTTSYATGSVTQAAPGQNTDLDIAGGFVGIVGLGSSVSQSYSSGAVHTISQSGDLDSFAGGFVGLVNPTGSVSDSYSLSSVTGDGGFNIIGGFAGLTSVGPSNDAGGISTATEVGSINNVYASGRVSGSGLILAGLVGLNQGSISNAYWDVGSTGQGLGFVPSANPPGSAVSSAVNIIGLSGSAAYAQGSYGGFDFSASGPWVIFDGATRPMLRMEASTTISNAHQLQLMALDPTASYVLASDIDLSATANTSDVWNPDTGFSPIGGNGEAAFTGSFNGAGHTLSNLFIDHTAFTPTTVVDGTVTFTPYGIVGLFGSVEAGASISNVALADANVTGGASMMTGGLVGYANGATITGASISGTVTGGDQPGTEGVYIGGLVGGVSTTTLSDVHSSANVSAGENAYVGGLIGGLGYGSSLTNASASGAVSVGEGVGFGLNSYSTAGGLAGFVLGFDATAVNYATTTVSNAYATGSVSGGGGSLLGGFVGTVQQANVSDVYSTGSVTLTTPGDKYNFAGGFAGQVANGGVVSDAYSSGAVSVTGASAPYQTFAGGFVGYVDSSGSVSNAYSLSPVSATAGGGGPTFLGGFAGLISGPGSDGGLANGSVDRVYATGSLSGVGLSGGLAGLNGGSLTNSYWDAGTTGQSTFGFDNGGSTAGLTAVGGSTGVNAYAAVTYANLDTSASGPWVIFDGATRPMLRMEASTTISNAHQLQLMALDPSANYVLANDIDLSATSNTTDVWNPATGFVPVGGNGAAAFTGTFDGGGHTISNLFINNTSVSPGALDGYSFQGLTGLFGLIGAGGLAEHVALSNVNVTGADGMTVGALAGDVSDGQVIDVSSSGSVTGGSGAPTNAGVAVGGLIGAALDGARVSDSSSSASVRGGDYSAAGGLIGSLISGASVDSSSASGDVSTGGAGAGGTAGAAQYATAGGLVGTADGYEFGKVDPSLVSISNSYASGPVSGGGGSIIGGFVGVLTQGQVSTSYATGAVTQTAPGQAFGSDLIGGFAGFIGDTATVNQSYSSGTMTAVGGSDASLLTFAGGFVGDVDGTAAPASIADSYSLSAVNETGANGFVGGFAGLVNVGADVERVYAAGGAAGQGPTAGLVGLLLGGQVGDSYWDEGTTGQVNGYLPDGGAANNVVGVGGSTGLSAYAASTYGAFDLNNTWVIADGSTRPILRMEYSTTISNAHQLQLMALDPSANYVLASDIDLSATASASDVWNPATGFVPIGGNDQPAFTGTFDGAGHTLSNLFINLPSTDAVGLFGQANAGTIENVTLNGGSVTGAGAVGALVGYNQASIINVVTSVTVSGASSVGGLVGFDNGGAVSASSASGDVSGGSSVGGLVGDVEFASIDASSASGSVNLSGAGEHHYGGLVGFADGSTISNSSASGAVTAQGDAFGVGGLVGDAANGSVITGSTASGAVTGAQVTGGLVGNLQSGSSIDGSSAFGQVSGLNGEVGGLVGDNQGAISNAQAHGSVSAVDAVGGLVGYNDQGTVTSSQSSGVVSGVSNVGGLIGFDNAGGVSLSSASGAVSGSNSVGGLIGYVQSATIDESSATGAVNLVGDGDHHYGGLIGFTDNAVVSNSVATGDVTAQNGANGVGGLIGDATDATVISNSQAHGAVSGDIVTGGLVGGLDSGSSIDGSSASGAVVGLNGQTGGLVGRNEGAISNASASGAVYDATNTVGGLVGLQVGTGTISGSSASGSVSSSYAVGGLVGENDGAITNASSSAVVTCIDYCGGNTGGLVGINASGTISFSSASGAVTGRESTGGLVGWTQGGSIQSSSASGGVSGVDGIGGLVGAATGGSITDSNASGTVSGGNTVGGLVGDTQNGAVTISNDFATGDVSATNGIAGGLIGQADAQVSNSYATGSVVGSADVGGLVGRAIAGAAISSAYATGAVTGGDGGQDVGGLVGELDSARIDDSSASGAVTAGQGVSGVGGLVGSADAAIITGSSASGPVLAGVGDQSVGGLVGELSSGGSITMSAATASVTAGNNASRVGGLVGFVEGSNITTSSASGDVSVGTSSFYVGGLVGWLDGQTGASSVSDSGASGLVSGDNTVGGLVGAAFNRGFQVSISNADATGSVNGYAYVGGLVGGLSAGTVTNASASGAVSGQYGGVGGLAGYVSNGQVSGSFATGAVSGDGNSQIGGFAGEILSGSNVTTSYATGSVTQTGAVDGANALAGGFVGYVQSGGAVSQSFSSGAVIGVGGVNASYYSLVGGFAGYADAGASVTDSYSAGPVMIGGSSNFVAAGGFAGATAGNLENVYALGGITAPTGALEGGVAGDQSGGALTHAYWDSGTTGQTVGVGYSSGGTDGSVGLTTAQLQSGLPSGFSSGVWTTVAGETYPYLNWQFPGGAPQVVSGYAYQHDGVTAYAGGVVDVYYGGSPLTSALTGGATTSGANGYYYYLLAPGTLATSTSNNVGALLYAPGGSPLLGLGYNGGGSLADGSMTALDIADADPFLRTSATAYSALTNDLSATFGAAVYQAATSALGQTGDLTQIQATGAFTIDVNLSSADRVQIEAGGDLTIASGASITSSASGDAIVLAADGNFINDAGAGVLSAANGRWLIYSQAHGDPTAAPTADVFGGLSAKSYYGDAFTFGAATTDAFAASPNAGDRFVYGDQPTLTVTANTGGAVYSGQAQTDGYTVSGLQNGDLASDAVQGELTTASKDVGVYALGSGLVSTLTSDENYAFANGAGALTITPASLTASLIAPIDKTYDGTTAAAPLVAGEYQLNGLFAGDTVALSDPTNGIYATKHVGSGLLVAFTGLSLTGADAADYSLTATSASGAVGEIDPKLLTASLIGSTTKVYNGSTAASLTAANYSSLSGVVVGDTVNLSHPTAGTYAGKDVGASILVTATGVKLSGASAGDYIIGPVSGAIGAITPKTLTASLSGSVAKTYDGTTAASVAATNEHLSGVVAGDTVALSGGTAAYGSKDVGSGLAVNVSGVSLAGAQAGDYVLASNGLSANIGKITPATLTVALQGSASKTYDGTTVATLDVSNYVLSGVVAADAGQIALYNPTNGTYDTKHVGTGKTIKVTGLSVSGADAGDYTLATTASGAIGEIDALAISVALTGTVSKIYDGTTAATLAASNYQLSGVLAGDSVKVVNPGAGAYAGKGVGTLIGVTVNGVGLTGSGAGDYVLVDPNVSGSIGTITPATLVASLTGLVDKTYDGTTTANLVDGNYQLSGVLAVDSGQVTLNDPLTGTHNNKNVGTGKAVTVTGLGLTGLYAGDYVLKSTSVTASIGEIDAKLLNAGLTGVVDKTYNGTTVATLTAANYGLTGVVAGDSVNLNNPTSGVYSQKDVGSGLTVTVSGVKLTGAGASNYTLGGATSLSAAIGEIDPKTLNAALTGTVSRIYDATRTATLTAANYRLTGAVAGDAVALNDPTSGTYDTKDVGTGKVVTVNGVALTGAAAGDYALATSTLTGAIGVITPYTLTASLMGVVSKVYDGTTLATLAPANYAPLAVFAGDSVTLSQPTTGTYASKGSATVTTTGIKVTVTGLAISGTDAGDYKLASTSTSNTVGTILHH